MGNLFKKYKSKVINNGRRFLSTMDFFELNLYKRELQNFNPLTNNHNSVTTGPTEQIILNEPFGLNGLDIAGFPYYNPPINWTSDPNTVFYGDSDTIPFCALSGSSGTVFSLLANGNNNTDYITTKAISTVGKTNIKLNFNEYRGLTAAPPAMMLDYSPDNGTNWVSITWTETNTILSWINSGDISLPVGAENKAQLKIRYGIVGNSSGEFVSIDDFIVKATF